MDQNNFGSIDEILRYLGYDKKTKSFNFDKNTSKSSENNSNKTVAYTSNNRSDNIENEDVVNTSNKRHHVHWQFGNGMSDNGTENNINDDGSKASSASGNRGQCGNCNSSTWCSASNNKKYKVDIDPTAGASSNCCINENLDILCGFQDINPTVFVIIGEVIGDLLSGQLPFNMANAVANWLNLVGQIIETYSAQQVYLQAGPGRYYSPLYRNVSNPFCSCTEVSNDSDGNGTSGDSASGSEDTSSGAAGTTCDSSKNTSSGVTGSICTTVKNGETGGTGSICVNDQSRASESSIKNGLSTVGSTGSEKYGAVITGDNNISNNSVESKNIEIRSNSDETSNSENMIDNRENLKKSIERIDNEILYMKKQFKIFNKKVEELKRNIESMK